MLEKAFHEQFPRCTEQRKVVGFVADAKACFDNWLKTLDE